jgi:hypothetical protein
LGLLVITSASGRVWGAPLEAFIAASVDGRPAAPGAVMAKVGQTVTLYAVLSVGQGKSQRFLTAAPALSLHGRAVSAARLQPPPADLHFAWSLVEPYPHHVALPPPNPGNPAYSNALLFGPHHGRWLGYDTIEYHETPLPDEIGPRMTVTRVMPSDAHVNVHDGLGTMRYEVAITGTLAAAGGAFSAASPGAESREAHGISPRVMRVSVRRGDDLPGLMSAFYNVPNVFGSGGTGDHHQTDLFQGADCADVIIGALRAVGVKLPYASVKGLFAYARPVTGKLLLDEAGLRAWTDGKPGVAVHLRFASDVRPGDIMLIDYVNAADLPRTWDHVAIVARDAGARGEFDGKTPVMHMGYLYGLTEASAASEGPAVVQFLRWKPSVADALTRAVGKRSPPAPRR